MLAGESRPLLVASGTVACEAQLSGLVPVPQKTEVDQAAAVTPANWNPLLGFLTLPAHAGAIRVVSPAAPRHGPPALSIADEE